MMSLAVEPGVLYEWPEHVPVPEGYPPPSPSVSAADWLIERFGETAFVPPLVTDFIGGDKVTPNEALRIQDLLCRVRASEHQWYAVRRDLISDYQNVAAFAHNDTLSWQREREAAYAGTTEMRAGMTWLVKGAAGSGKSKFALWLAWRDFLAAKRAGFNRAMGLTGTKWDRFGPWNHVADPLDWDENRKDYPDGVGLFIDDPLDLPDSENEELYAVAYLHMANVTITERDRGDRFTIAKINEPRIPEGIFTDRGMTYKNLRVPDRYGLAMRMEMGSTGAFNLTGFFLVVDTVLDIGGPAAYVGGAALALAIRKKKREAHHRLYQGMSQSRAVANLSLSLAERPVEAVANCFTRGKQKSWLSRVFSAERSYSPRAVELSAEHWWQAVNNSDFSLGRDKETTGTNKIALLDSDGVARAWPGSVPGEDACRWIVDQWRVFLQPIQAVDKRDRAEGLRKHRQKYYPQARGVA